MQQLELVDADSGGVHFGRGIHLDTRSSRNGKPLALVLTGAERVEEDRAFLDDLARTFDVVAPSHPGFGRSILPPSFRSVDDLAYLYLDWLDAVDAEGVTLVGLQFGGWIAMEMAIRNSTRIAQLVLVDTAGVKIGGPTDRDVVDVFATSHDRLEELTYADPAFRLGPLSQADETRVLEVMRNDEALATYGWQPYMHNPRLKEWLWRIEVPTQVIWGAADGIVSPDHGRVLAEAVPQGVFTLLDGVGHRPQVEAPRRVAELVAAASPLTKAD